MNKNKEMEKKIETAKGGTKKLTITTSSGYAQQIGQFKLDLTTVRSSNLSLYNQNKDLNQQLKDIAQDSAALHVVNHKENEKLQRRIDTLESENLDLRNGILKVQREDVERTERRLQRGIIRDEEAKKKKQKERDEEEKEKEKPQ